MFIKLVTSNGFSLDSMKNYGYDGVEEHTY